MPNKQEKERRKQLMDEITQKQKFEFENNLPMEKEKIIGLFDYLDKKLSETYCDDTNRMTKEYLEKAGQSNIENILKWLSENNGCCDCEILANVEELFE
jgi:hypothetical protein